MSSLDPNQAPQPRRTFRVSLEVALAGLIALALLVVILAGVFSLGQRRLEEVETKNPATGEQPHALRGTPGLQAPAPLPQAQGQPVDPIPMTRAPEAAPVPPEPSHDETAFVPPAVAPVPVEPPIDVAPALAPPAAHVPPRISLGDYLGYTQFTKIRDAHLNRPDPLVNPEKIQRPQATSDMAQIRSQSRLTPEAVRELVAERQAMQSLWERRSQARINPNRLASPTTQPTVQ